MKWLGDFIEMADFWTAPQKLAEGLTQVGIEVDSFEDQKARFDKLLIAQIVSVKKHPQADRLSVCEVQSEVQTDQKSFSIVCGAKNHKAGDKVVLALPGAILANGLKIKKSRIRGEDSEGMLVSQAELGLETVAGLKTGQAVKNFVDENKAAQQVESFAGVSSGKSSTHFEPSSQNEEGIWILPPSAPLGQSLAEYKNWDDILFDITVPPNRSDCLSHKGLAREVSSLFSLPLKKENQIPLSKSEKLEPKLNSKSYFSIKVSDKVACPRYCACFIEGLQVKESPKWLKQRLNSVGLKSINNVVDATNFILWDQGQPLHAFDRDKIESIEITLATEGEKFLGLDENEFVLSLEDLTIRDKKGALALAGVMGGLDSGISRNTKNIMIESAYFAPERIRKSSRRLGLETDSSYRFTRGIDPVAVFSAMERAALLIQKLAGGRISKYVYDINKVSLEKKSITISLKDLFVRLGYKIPAPAFEKRMREISCDLSSVEKTAPPDDSSNTLYKVSPPSHRADLKIKEDLIEEFARLEGYNKIPENTPSVFFPSAEPERSFLNFQSLTRHLSSRSWLQALHYSFCDPDYYEDFLNSKFYLEDLLGEEPIASVRSKESTKARLKKEKRFDEKNLMKAPAGWRDSKSERITANKASFMINNPISQKLSLMKPLLTPDLFKSIVQNFRKSNKQGRLFELSPVFYREGESYQQDWNLALGIWGADLDIWQSASVPNFYKMKGELKVLFQALDFKKWSWEPVELSFLHPKKSLALECQKKKIGFMGALHPLLAEKHKIPVEVVLAELNLSFLTGRMNRPADFKAFSKFLTVEKDLCFIVPESLPVQKVKKEIEKTLSGVCQEALIFDIYKKEGQRFVSFRLCLSSNKKSWTDEELNSFLKKVIQSMDQKFSIKLKP